MLWRRDALAVSHTRQYDLDSLDSLERRQMGCVKSDRPRLVACTVHLSTRDDPESQGREIAVVARTANGWAAAYPTIVGGDFNETPEAGLLNQMWLPDYGAGAKGRFREIDDLADRDGEATHPVRLGFDEKIDYIFFTRNLRWGGGDATTAGARITGS